MKIKRELYEKLMDGIEYGVHKSIFELRHNNTDNGDKAKSYGYDNPEFDNIELGEGSYNYERCSNILKSHKDINSDFTPGDKEYLINLRADYRNGDLDAETMQLIDGSWISDIYKYMDVLEFLMKRAPKIDKRVKDINGELPSETDYWREFTRTLKSGETVTRLFPCGDNFRSKNNWKEVIPDRELYVVHDAPGDKNDRDIFEPVLDKNGKPNGKYLLKRLPQEYLDAVEKNKEKNRNFAKALQKVYSRVLHNIKSKNHFFYGLIEIYDPTKDPSSNFSGNFNYDTAFIHTIQKLLSNNYFGDDSFFVNYEDSINLNWINTSSVTSMKDLFQGLGSNQHIEEYNPKKKYTFNDIVQVKIGRGDAAVYNTETQKFEKKPCDSYQYYKCIDPTTGEFDENAWEENGVLNIPVYGSDKEKNPVIDTQFSPYILPKHGRINIELWDTGNVTCVSHMFARSNFSRDIDISNWDLHSVTDMSYMFAESDYTCDLSNCNIPVTANAYNAYLGNITPDEHKPESARNN